MNDTYIYRKPIRLSNRTSVSIPAKGRRAERYEKLCKPAGIFVDVTYDSYEAEVRTERCGYCKKEVVDCRLFANGLAPSPKASNFVAYQDRGMVSSKYDYMDDMLPPSIDLTAKCGGKSAVVTKKQARPSIGGVSGATQQQQTGRKAKRWKRPVFVFRGQSLVQS
jgi:hypothetical protein